MSRWIQVSLLAVAMTACGNGGDDGGNSGRPSNLDGPCEDGGDCGTGEFCFANVEASAVCQTVPAACSDDPCGDCEEMEAMCDEASQGSSCLGFGTNIDFECF